MSQQTDVYSLIKWLSTCFGHHYAHRQENKTVFNTAYGGAWFCWLWLCGAGTFAVCTVCTLLTSRLHTTTASKTRHHRMRC